LQSYSKISKSIVKNPLKSHYNRPFYRNSILCSKRPHRKFPIEITFPLQTSKDKAQQHITITASNVQTISPHQSPAEGRLPATYPKVRTAATQRAESSLLRKRNKPSSKQTFLKPEHKNGPSIVVMLNIRCINKL
jgi:hypothetical protein